jgi:hypothetical protein
LLKQIRNTINRALPLHNYSFRNLEKYFSLKEKRRRSEEGKGALYR